MMSVAGNLLLIEERLEKACRLSGRNRDEIRLMGVTKFHGRSVVEEAWKAGVDLFGENRVQEAEKKFEGRRESFPGLDLHLIGSLQRNKARKAAAFFDCIESVDREALITALGACTTEFAPLKILFELHAGEESKRGFPDEDGLLRAAELALSFPGLKPAGLMAMAPFTADEASVRAAFRRAARARERLAAAFPEADWSCLSMGMSGDFEIAVEEGSTLVRIGTILFGERLP
ncbi:MAG: YggS family pyridoxal phosphate-dependent enzyme [Treponema sp.]|jgi:pyridoxal phosphate enzyme (YggS family)|nr:YggS family pyridoxal phosphate-dependent enzyme [Treponema sp.]